VGIIHPAGSSNRNPTPPFTVMAYEEQDWSFAEVEYGPGGRWDLVTTSLHIAGHPGAIRQQIGSPRAPFQDVAPSAAVSAPGDHLSGAWEGCARGYHLRVAPRFVVAALDRDIGPDAVERRHFAYRREPDATDAIIQSLLGAMAVNLRDGNVGGSLFMETVALALVRRVACQHRNVDSSTGRGGLTQVQLATVMDLIESLVEMAGVLNLSTRYFCQAFRQSTGLSPHQFIIKRRVALARELIESEQLSLTEVALAAGFNDHSQMTATFRKVLGCAPSHFRNNRK
jgi:AraC-like DNA-binding protein